MAGVQLGPVKLKTHTQHGSADAGKAAGVPRRGLGWDVFGRRSGRKERRRNAPESRWKSPWPPRWDFGRQGGAAPWQFVFHGGFRALGEHALGVHGGRDLRFSHLKGKAISLILSLSSFYNIII